MIWDIGSFAWSSTDGGTMSSHRIAASRTRRRVMSAAVVRARATLCRHMNWYAALVPELLYTMPGTRATPRLRPSALASRGGSASASKTPRVKAERTALIEKIRAGTCGRRCMKTCGLVSIGAEQKKRTKRSKEGLARVHVCERRGESGGRWVAVKTQSVKNTYL